MELKILMFLSLGGGGGGSGTAAGCGCLLNLAINFRLFGSVLIGIGAASILMTLEFGKDFEWLRLVALVDALLLDS
jgi:hypothetical protein